jgi:hypothetical protein
LLEKHHLLLRTVSEFAWLQQRRTNYSDDDHPCKQVNTVSWGFDITWICIIFSCFWNIKMYVVFYQ